LNTNFGADDAATTVVNQRFSGVVRAMLTLVSFVTMDSISSVYEPILDVQPWLCLYFFPIIVIVSIAIMNLVLATLLQSAMRSVELDKEFSRAQKRADFTKLRPSVRTMFEQIDADEDGEITVEEICKGRFDVPLEYRDKITLPAVLDLFSTIDTDGSGTIGPQEWEQALLCLALRDAPVESTQMMSLLRQQARKLSTLGRDMHRVITTVSECAQQLRPGEDMGASAWRADVWMPDDDVGKTAQTIFEDARGPELSPRQWELSVAHPGMSLGTSLQVSPRPDAVGIPCPNGDLTPLEQH